MNATTLYLLGILLVSEEPLKKKLAAIQRLVKEPVIQVFPSYNESDELKGYVLKINGESYWLNVKGNVNKMSNKPAKKNTNKPAASNTTKKGKKQNQNNKPY